MKDKIKSWGNIGLSSVVAVLGVLEGVNWLTLTGDETTAGWTVTAIALVNILIQSFKKSRSNKTKSV